MESFQDRFIAAVRKKIGDARCPLCGTSSWAVQEGVYRFRQHIKTENGEMWGDALPSAALICNNCGNTQFVNVFAYGDAFKGDV